jgi:O-antigen ligase
MLGSFLALAGVWILPQFRRRGKWLLAVGGTFFGVGIALLLLARVRTGMIVTGLGLIVLFVIGVQQGPGFAQFFRSFKPKRPRDWVFVGGAVLVLAGIIVIASQNVAVQEIGHLPHDHRVNSRVDAIEKSWDVAKESPVTGWGPGSASSGLRLEFVDAGKTFEAPHNGALGLVIEGGLGALLAFLAIFGTALVNIFREFRLGRQKPATGIAIAAIIPVLGFWVVGDALAALPVSLCLCLITGIYLANGIALDRREEPGGE